MVASVPERCFAAGPGDACRLRIGFHRDRKTGPCFPLAVLRCATHRRASTLYPPGHVPYGRTAVAPVDARAELIVSDRSVPDGSRGRPAWELTVFAAAVDAEQGRLWPKEASERIPATDSPRRRTQGRHLTLASEMLGLASVQSSRTRERIAWALAVPSLVLREAARDLEDTARYVEEGRIVARVLGQLRPVRGLGDQLLAAGEIAGLWGAPRRWDPGGFEIRRPFREFAATT